MAAAEDTRSHSGSDSDCSHESLDMPELEEHQIVVSEEGKKYELLKFLCDGHFAVVWKARPIVSKSNRKKRGRRPKGTGSDDADVAIKFYTTDDKYDDIRDMEAHNLEVVDGSMQKHLQSCLGQVSMDMGNDMVLLGNILPLAQRDLRTFLTDDGVLKAKNSAQVIYQLCLGLQHLHSHGIAHGDLKPENVLMYPRLGSNRQSSSRGLPHVVISDFDSLQYYTPKSLKKHGARRPRIYENEETVPCDEVVLRFNEEVGINEHVIGLNRDEEMYVEEPCITKEYRSPEYMLASAYDWAGDIWALGCIYFELRTNYGLFDVDYLRDVSDDEGENEDEKDDDENEDGKDDEDEKDEEDEEDEGVLREARSNIDHMLMMINVLGPVPPCYFNKYPQLFTSTGTLHNVDPVPSPAKDLFINCGLGRKDSQNAAALIDMMLRYDREERKTAEQIETFIRSSYKSFQAAQDESDAMED